MTKAVFVLNYFISERKLKDFCKNLSQSKHLKKDYYKFSHSVANEIRNPSKNLKLFYDPYIPLSWWEEKATNDFKLAFDSSYEPFFKSLTSININ